MTLTNFRQKLELELYLSVFIKWRYMHNAKYETICFKTSCFNYKNWWVLVSFVLRLLLCCFVCIRTPVYLFLKSSSDNCFWILDFIRARTYILNKIAIFLKKVWYNYKKLLIFNGFHIVWGEKKNNFANVFQWTTINIPNCENCVIAVKFTEFNVFFKNLNSLLIWTGKINHIKEKFCGVFSAWVWFKCFPDGLIVHVLETFGENCRLNLHHSQQM